MAEYTKGGGSFLDSDKVADGVKIKVVGECVKVESKFKNTDGTPKPENHMPIRVKGAESSITMRVNWTSIYGMIDAFGTDSKGWVEKVVTLRKREMTVGDKVYDVCYLIPDGFELAKNAEKKLVIRKVGVVEESVDVSDDDDSKEFVDSIPF